MTKPEKIDFDKLPNPFNQEPGPQISEEDVLNVAKNPNLIEDFSLQEKMRFAAGALKLMVSSEELRNQVIEILKKRSEQK